MELGQINPEDFNPSNRARMDEQLFVRFYIKPVLDREKTTAEGRSIYVDTEYVEIRVPGSKDAVARPARHDDVQRFPKHYEAFKQRIELPLEGTPLREWPLATRSMVEELAFSGIKTVEQLANVPDSNLSNMMGLGNLKRQAQEWLQDAQDDAGLVKLTEQLRETESQLAARDQTIAQLSERLAALEATVASAAGSPAPDAAPSRGSPSVETDLHSSLDAESGGADDVSSTEQGADEPAPPVSEARQRRRRRRAAAGE